MCLFKMPTCRCRTPPNGRNGCPSRAESPQHLGCPGVYLFRETGSQMIRYAGMAGERAGGGRPQGLHGRLNVYRTGKGAVSGFGEAALDRALSDVDWLQQHVDRVRVQGPRRAKQWVADAVERTSPEISWAVCPERFDARVLEDRVVLLLRPHGVWNR